ncbi:amino acid/amide ABC transporter membrane protein 1 HAAT family (TC 3.A.1.4.-) [Ruminococcus sp. CAG:488]|nr:branched-chain amino acid ABC transporter permease [Oscillospiraceae bacterium]CDA19514.1 amino acid/amide ABC transporter membrane protein 1 HAAT family (TC 3.A.1.4.-) [Ruminococcus sp. CAG:488]
MLSTILDGLSLGAIYALIALGYTMVYGIAKMLNFAHGDIIMVGAYAILVTINANGHPLLGVVAAVVVCTVVGIVIEKVAYKPLRGASPLAVLITAIGVSYLLQSIAQLIFKSKSQAVTISETHMVNVGSAELNLNTILTLVVGAVIMVALTLFVKYTKTGRAMQAVSEDRGAAQLMGVNVNKIIMITFAIGSALAACAGVFYLMQIPSVSPTLGSMPGIKAFAAAVIGGIGSIPGAMLGGVILGVVEKLALSVPVLAPYATAIEFALLIVILLVRPIGILGKKRREKV